MRLASTALVLMACQSSGSDDSFPIVPGGDDTVITPAPDGPSADVSGDGSGTLTGRVCVVADLRNLTSCTTADASGITVTLGASSAITATDGTFSIAAPSGSNLTWTVSAVGFVPSVVPLGLVHLLPLVTQDRYNEMLLDNGVILGTGQGSLFTRVIRNAAPAVGVTATVDPPSLYGPLYDGANAILWDLDATGETAVIWIPDVLEGSTTLTLMPPATTPLPVSIPVVEAAITFATVEVP